MGPRFAALLVYVLIRESYVRNRALWLHNGRDIGSQLRIKKLSVTKELKYLQSDTGFLLATPSYLRYKT